MAMTETTPDALDTAAAAAAGSGDQPIFMLNLLRYNDRADYADGAGFPPCSGREAYFTRYVPAFGKLVESDAYRTEADPHRAAALADWRLIATGKADLPG